MISKTILWRRLDQPGHEATRLYLHDTAWHLAGTAVFSDNQQPCRLEYHVICDANWHTRSGRVIGWVGTTAIAVELSVDAAQHWSLNGKEYPAVDGCLDLDLNFSPSTNLIPIRRLELAIGQAAPVRAAWLRFPTFKLEPLEQVYHRSGESAYHYEVPDSGFVRELAVDAMGFVTSYPGLWAMEASSTPLDSRP